MFNALGSVLTSHYNNTFKDALDIDMASPLRLNLPLCEAEWRICVGKLATIGSDNGLSPARRQAIIWTNDGILLIGTSEQNPAKFNQTFSFKKMHLKMSSAKWRPFFLDLNVLF